MGDLTGKKIKDTYGRLLQIQNGNIGLDGTLRSVEDGKGHNSQLELSLSEVNIVQGFMLGGTLILVPAEDINDVGLSGAVTYLVAGDNLSALRVVWANDSGEAEYADSSLGLQAVRTIGVTTNAASVGELARIKTYGRLEDNSWSWTVGSPIFFDELGQLTQDVPTTGFVLEVAHPISETEIFVDIKHIVLLEG